MFALSNEKIIIFVVNALLFYNDKYEPKIIRSAIKKIRRKKIILCFYL